MSSSSGLTSLRPLFVLLLLPHCLGEEPSATKQLLQRQYLALAPPASLDPASRPTAPGSCQVTCKSNRRRWFCASDGRTYASKCDIRHARKCLKLDLHIVARGPCTVASPALPPSYRPLSCEEERQRLQSQKRDPKVHVPDCWGNGSYKETQCFSGWCWCVNEYGQPIPKTSVNGSRPNCIGRQVSSKTRRGASRKCYRQQRLEFNSNIIKAFTQEYHRLHSNDTSGETPESFERLVISWKFQSLDTNQNDQLSSRELRELRKLVRKHFKPRRCAKRFHKYCDKDGDKSLSRTEWILCFGQNHGLRGRRLTPHPDKPSGPGGSGRTERQTRQRLLYSSLNSPSASRHRAGRITHVGLLNPRSSRPNPSQSDEPDRPMDCPSERRRAEEQHRLNPNGQVFIPACTDGGLFHKAQCHVSGYCWCVDQQTGQTIPGYSTKEKLPNCENVQPRRQIRDCPNKRAFITFLMDRLAMEMVEFASSNPHSGLISMNPQYTIEERVARYKFSILDQNNNQKLERRETREFKEALKTLVTSEGQKSLRKCARNFVRSCDADDSGKIMVNEWIGCLTAPKHDGLRSGQNPFRDLLER